MRAGSWASGAVGGSIESSSAPVKSGPAFFKGFQAIPFWHRWLTAAVENAARPAPGRASALPPCGIRRRLPPHLARTNREN